MRTSHTWFFRLCALEGVIALVALMRIPSEGGNPSPARLVLLATLLSLIAVFGYAGIRPSRIPDALARTPIVWTAAQLSITISLILFLLRYLAPGGDLLPALYERLGPVLWYLLVLSIQFTLFLLSQINGFHPESLKQNNPIFHWSLIAFCVLLAALLFVSLTKLGITKDEAYWGEPGVAIAGWQFVTAILLGAAILIFQLLAPKSSNSSLLSFLFPLAIWLAASILWLNVPIASLRNSFYAPITPPYATPFPYSDAGFYDYLSQSLLIGTDYLGGIPPRPLYVTFLAALHFLFGQDYVKIIAAQTLVLALFPVALYFLGSKLHSRAAGVAAAFFAIFRELTTLWISSDTRTAGTKMFITDFATATAIAFTCLAAIRWFERRDTKSALIAGGSFGLLLLLRTQSLIILPVLFLIAFFVFQKNIKEWLRSGIAFGMAMTFTIAPWLIHNYTVTGALTFDDPAQMAVIYSQYSFSENLDISRFDPGTDSLADRLITFTMENPGFVGGFITNHFLNTEIGGLLALPLIEPFNGLSAPVNLYWIEWDGSLAWYNLALIVFYLAVIAIGIGAAWARLTWIGLVPLAFNIGYALANGISRFSSWRYNLPVDWVIYFYFAIGAIEIVLWMAQLFGAGNFGFEKVPAETPTAKPFGFTMKHALIAAAFIGMGSLPWLAKGLAQPRYMSTVDQLREEVVARGMDPQALDEFLSQPDAILLEGKTLYPRFFLRNDGIFSANPWPVYKVREYARLGFLVLNSSAGSVIFPANKPLAFPHGSDALVVGCQFDDHIEARWIYFAESDEVFQSGILTEACSP